MNTTTEKAEPVAADAHLDAPSVAPSNGSRFLDLARKLAAVPKSEFDAEAEAVKNGKPLKPLPKPAH